jgi:hypothetical protein
MSRFEYDSEETGATPLVDRLDDLIALADFVLQVRVIKDAAKELLAIEKKKAAAKRELAEAKAETARIREAAHADAAQIREAAKDEVAEDKADREHHAEQAAWQARYDRLRAQNPNMTNQQILEALAEGDDTRRHGGTFMNVREGFGDDHFAPSTLTRSVPV